MYSSTSSSAPIPVVTIEFLDGSEKGKTIHIRKPVTTIGHELSKDIVVQGLSTSSEFARIIEDNGAYYIEKRCQDIIVRVNEHLVGQKVALHDGDTIGLGPVVTAFRFENPFEGGQAPGQIIDTEASSHEPMLELTSNISQMRVKYSLPLTMLSISIGREPSNDIVIDEPFVDPFHVQIIREDHLLKLVHPHPRVLSTSNGLWYQDQHIQGTEHFEHPLSQCDVFLIKNQYGTFIKLTYDDGSGVIPEKADVSDTTIALDRKDREIIIGRQVQAGIVLDHPTIARRHARLVQDRQGAYYLVNESRVTNVSVNGRQVIKKSDRLKANDEIRIGPYRFVYTEGELKEYDERNGIRIDAYELVRYVNKQKIVLNDISLAVKPGRFVALVGGSGAGKSTLMEALNGLRPAQEGAIYYNGQHYYSSLAAFRTQLGYVPQSDIVHGDLTVERVLYYGARLRLPKDKDQFFKERIEKVLTDVSLDQQRTILVKKLSGGQKKRVSIALELLAEPSIFFLDEPTSGLDPGLDRQMMALLKALANKGHTIVLVTHATNNINVCDYICFLCLGGRMAYFGPPLDAPSYFGTSDFAEIYSSLDFKTQEEAIKAEQRFKTSQEYKKHVAGLLKPQPTASSNAANTKRAVPANRGNAWQQFLLLSLRYLELLKNDRVNLAILLLQAPVIGVLLLSLILAVGADGFNANKVVQCPTTAVVINAAGYPDAPSPANPVVSDKSCQRVENFLASNPRGKAYARSRGGTRAALQDFILPGPGYAATVLFIMAFSAIMFGCINAAREFVKEAHIYRRERAVNLGLAPYMFSKIIVLGFLCLLQSLALVGIVNIVDPFRHSVFLMPFVEVYITIALLSLAGLMMGLLVSALVPNNDRAMSFVPVLLIPQVMFSGVIFPMNGWFLQIVGALWPIRWAMAALGSSVGLHSDKLNGDQLFGENYTYHSTLFSTYTQADTRLYLLLTWLALGLTIVLLVLTITYFLKRKDVYR